MVLATFIFLFYFRHADVWNKIKLTAAKTFIFLHIYCISASCMNEIKYMWGMVFFRDTASVAGQQQPHYA